MMLTLSPVTAARLRGTLAAAFCSLLSQAALSADQCINAGAPAPLEICVQDNGTPGVWVAQPNGRQHQYYASYAWGSSIRLGELATQHYSTSYFGQNAVTPVSNSTSGSGTAADPYVITTVVTLGASDVRLTQRFRYVNGDRNFSKIWTLENTGTTTYSDVRFFHGGDTYFGGNDSARSWYDADLRMVYVNNSSFSNSGYMAFYANPLTPLSHYFSGSYWSGWEQVTEGALDDSFDSTFLDAGYYLQWNRAELRPGETWRIEAFETWSPPGSLQVLTPGDEYVTPGTTVRKTFKVHNLSDVTPLSVTLAASTPSGWTLSMPGGASATLAPLQVVEVPVDVQIPAGAAAGLSADIVLDVTDGALNTMAGTTRVRIPSTDYSFSVRTLDFGSAVLGTQSELVVTFANGSDQVSIGQVGAPNGLAAPFSIVADTCSNATVAAWASCTVTVRFAPTLAADYSDSFSIPVAGDALVNETIAVTGTGFEQLAVTISATAGAGGTITPASQDIAPGTAATFTLVPDVGYQIGTASGCAGSLNGNTFTTQPLTAACTLSVTFVEQMSEVVISGKGKGGGGSFGLISLGGLLLLALRRIRRVAALAAAGIAVAGGAQAGEAPASGFHAGLSLATATSSEKLRSLTSALQAQGYAVTASIDDKRMAWRIHGGWSFNRFLAVEIGYSDLGKVSTEFAGTLPVLAVDSFLADAVLIHPRTADGFDFSLAGRYLLAFAQKFSAQARVGAFRWDAERRVSTSDDRSASRNDKGTDLLLGIGIGYEIAPRIGVTAEWMRYGLGNENVRSVSLGARYHW